MKIKSHTTKLLTLILLAVFAALGAYIFMYFKTATASNRLGEIKAQINLAAAKDRELEAVREDIKSTFGDYEKIQGAFIPSDGVVDFIQMLESAGSALGVVVKVDSVQDGEIDGASDRQKLSVLLYAGGSKKDVETFLTFLENLPYKVTIHDAMIRKTDAKEETTAAWQVATNISVLKIK